MSKILFAWELGAGYGHISGFLLVAKKLREQGHEVIFLLKELAYAEELLGPQAFTYFQAPVRSTPPKPFPPPNNYAEILRNCGFWGKGELIARIKAWQNLYELLSPDLLVIDHAPTALLAARGTQIKRVLFGNGFFSPPRITPMPNIRPWLNVPQSQLIASEQNVLALINSAYNELGVEPLTLLTDVFEADEDFLCTFPELDHYQSRGAARYWGPRLNLQQGVDAVWPSGEGKKIFAYLSTQYPHIEKLLAKLPEVPGRFLIHIGGGRQDLIRKYRAANVSFSQRPVDLSQVITQCDVAIGHGGPGTATALLLKGRPLLLLPMHVEQFLTSRGIAQCHAGIVVHPEQKQPNFKKLIKQLLTDSKLVEGAQEFANKYAGFNADEQNEAIVNRCVEILA